MRNRYGFSLLISTAVLAAACAHRSTTSSLPSAEVACSRAYQEAMANAIEDTWSRPLSAFQTVTASSRNQWKAGITVRHTYWSNQCVLARQREAELDMQYSVPARESREVP